LETESQKGISPEANENEQSNEKLSCPNSMVKYDDTAPGDNAGPLSVSKNGTKIISLNEEAAASSSLNGCTESCENPRAQKTLALRKTPTEPTNAPKAPKGPKAPKAQPRPM